VQEVRKLGGAIAVETFEDSRIALLKVSRLSHEQSCRKASPKAKIFDPSSMQVASRASFHFPFIFPIKSTDKSAKCRRSSALFTFSNLAKVQVSVRFR
jgi:hypothetical protein